MCIRDRGGTALASWFLSPDMDASARPGDSYLPTDPVTVSTQSVRLTAPVPLATLVGEGPSPIDYSPVQGPSSPLPQPDDPAAT